MGTGVRPIAMDVTDLASVEAVAREDDEPVDLLLNTAGIIGQGGDGPGEVNYAEWARVLDVNTMGPVRVLDAFADRLAAAGRRQGDHADQRPGLDRRRGLGLRS